MPLHKAYKIEDFYLLGHRIATGSSVAQLFLLYPHRLHSPVVAPKAAKAALNVALNQR